MVALVDTGFTGELKIPPDKVLQFGLEVTHTQPVSLADEQIINMSASLAYVSMEGVPNIVGVLISEGIPIVGVGLLKKFGYTLNIDCKYDTLFLQKNGS